MNDLEVINDSVLFLMYQGLLRSLCNMVHDQSVGKYVSKVFVQNGFELAAINFVRKLYIFKVVKNNIKP